MGTMFDAVDPANIPAECDGKPALRITVLADADGACFDVEAGNAGVPAVLAAVKARIAKGRWAVGYVNEDTFGQMSAAMPAEGLSWAGAEAWPAPGLYIWAADPSGNIAAGRWVLPVTPLAVQTGYHGSYDLSETAANFPAAAAGYIDGKVSMWPAAAWDRFAELALGGPLSVPVPPAPPTPPAPPAPTNEVDVRLPILQQGAQGPSVRAVQTLCGSITVDGIFGPVTHARVIQIQAEHHLTEDGIVGLHTWGALLGAPQ